MDISYTQELRFVCSTCQSTMHADAWVVIDTQERPDLYQALLDDSLNMIICASCGATVAPDGPLLLHDALAQQVYFAVPGHMGEHVWREYAQDLLRHLLQALPEEQHLPYIGDVQIEHGLAGVRGALTRRSRRAKRRQPAAAGQAAAPAPAPPVAPQPDSELLDAIETLLACDDSAELEAMLRSRPMLATPAAVTFIGTLIETAETQSEPEIARSLQHARSVLLGMQQGHRVTVRAVLEEAEHDASGEGHHLSDMAYQTLLHADSQDRLRDSLHEYPQLLEPWADTVLAERLEQALAHGHEHLAAIIEERSLALTALREELTREDNLRSALRALANAKTEESLLEAITSYPALLTETTQQALSDLHARTLARGETQRAALIDERRKMLSEVRRGLETL